MIEHNGCHMGGFFVYNQSEAILQQYDLEIKQISRGRGAYICETNEGKKLLMPFRGSKERAMFLREVLIRLAENGYETEQIMLTKEGGAVALDDMGTRYWLKDMISGGECSTSREPDMMRAVTQLARLHSALLAYAPEIPDFIRTDRNDPANTYRRHYRELIKVKNYVLARHGRNEFERRFLMQYEHYMQDAGEVIRMITEKELHPMKGLCHGDFNQHNVLRTADGFRIVNFENMSYAMPVLDLANFVRKMLEKNGWQKNLGMQLVEQYDRERTMSADERTLLYLVLLFPEKFWKISNHYSNSRKTWGSEREIEKLERMDALEEQRHAFLENMFLFL